MECEDIVAVAKVLFARERSGDVWGAVDQGIRNEYMVRVAKSPERYVQILENNDAGAGANHE